ncbi:MAG: SAM hydroxide adenosyltransferase [candidate division KSB1 bacterium]|jgi:S-adenosylmethionine hydrolase|nr:SAM hydroxide adenosyltransferase [candidate division KSB1 bacterium]
MSSLITLTTDFSAGDGFAGMMKGAILYVDHFGNLITNVHRSQLVIENICISFGNHEICGLKYSYEDVKKSNPVALVNSAGYIEIAVNQNRADRLLNLKPDDRIIITYEK